MKIEEIRQQCEALSNEELLLVVNNKRLYTEQIVRVAYQEIRKRKLSKEEVKAIEKVQVRRYKVKTGDFVTDILLFEKIGLFFFIVPMLHRLILRDYRRKGYLLKVRQGAYFAYTGLLSFFALLAAGVHRISFLTAAGIRVSFFFLTYALNQFYFRQKISQWLAARTNNEGPGQPEQTFYP
jgi:hypothetical protein